ncbi:MAG: sensor histidine kinase [Rhodobacteraceae bacterium]|nr:sensor histidine kinase [Paracoccaceae bacterium]MCY4251372.1 sensor histidine kinase [Paracoccaceae bacterium]
MDSSKKKVSFKVSARTARLIGRENVATSHGAITELVKNSYDADARMCALLFLRRFPGVPREITKDEYEYLCRLNHEIAGFFEKKGNVYQLPEGIKKTALAFLDTIFEDFLDLWIIDNGIGMTSETIEERWMVIGTDTKDTQFKSTGGRTMTGAKGIGRFALDRLGEKSELYSATADNDVLVYWSVDWNSFEGKDKKLDDVEASLEERLQVFPIFISELGLEPKLPGTVPGPNGKLEGLSYKTGTVLRLQYLRDTWNKNEIEKLKDSLEALLPPSERNDFSIFVYSHNENDSGEWLVNFPPDQFDYRLKASVKADGVVAIRLDRHEFDVERIRPIFYELEEVNVTGYNRDDFIKGFHSYESNLEKLLNPNGDKDISEAYGIGPFEFTFYFNKLTNPSKSILERFPQKRFDANKRRQWMSRSGGIRIYRDGFRVRPFGEPGSQSSDWLLLGDRTARNPTAVGTVKGFWPVPPQQVAGTIDISRVHNPRLDDQSNREGIKNNQAFHIFRQIVVALIHEFEKDRNRIHRNFNLAYKKDHPTEENLKKGDRASRKIIATQDKLVVSRESLDPETSLDLAKAYELRKSEVESLSDEIQVLRGMATLGTVLVSFTHELKQIKANMESRQTRMRKSLERVIDKECLKNIPIYVNPYDILERWEREDQKVSRWVDFALSSVTNSKRQRKQIVWQEYFNNLTMFWENIFQERKITFNFPIDLDSNLVVLAHEIDLDSVFFNLFINSIEVLTRPSQNNNRMIQIKYLSSDEKKVEFEYSDNGPGISKIFKTVSDIFNYGETSKPEEQGLQVEGTGIGMAILKEIIDDYGGNVRVLSELGGPGFNLEIVMPRYNKQPD